MARTLVRHTVRTDTGAVVISAKVEPLLEGTTTAISDAYAAETGGSAITSILTNAQGEAVFWMDTYRDQIDLRVSPNGTAYLPGASATLFSFATFTETVALPAPTGTFVRRAGGAAGVATAPLPFFNVRDYGADPTGVASASAAIQAALDAAQAYAVGGGYGHGGTVYVPSGAYKITTTLNLRGTVTVVGEGMLASTFVNDAGTSPVMVLAGASLAPSGVVLEKFGIVNRTGTGDAIRLNGTFANIITHVHIAEVFFDGNGVSATTSRGIFAEWALETVIEGCVFRGQGGIGIELGTTCNASVIRDNTLSNGSGGGATGMGIKLFGTSGVLVEGNVIEAYRGICGLMVDGCGATTIIRNWLEDNNGVQMIVGTIGSAQNCNGTVIMGNNDSPNGATTLSLDTPNDGTVGNLTLATMSNHFLSGVSLKPGLNSQTRYSLVNDVVGGSITDLTLATDRVMIYDRNGLSVKGPVINTEPVAAPRTVIKPHWLIGATFNAAVPIATDQARFASFTVNTPTKLDAVLVQIGVSSGNVDVGIYDSTGTSSGPGARLASSGSIPCPAAGSRAIALSAAVTLQPGLYYTAIVFDNITASIVDANVLVLPQAFGTGDFWLKNSSFPLPATTTAPTALGGTATRHYLMLAAKV